MRDWINTILAIVLLLTLIYGALVVIGAVAPFGMQLVWVTLSAIALYLLYRLVLAVELVAAKL